MDEKTYMESVIAMQRALYRVARSVLNNDADAADAVQELACLERLRLRTEDAELARSLSLRLRGGVDTLAFLFEVDVV